MPNRFIQVGRFGNLILFLFLELIAIFMIISFNNKQKAIFLYSTNLYVAEWNNKILNVKNYFKLTEINDSLQKTNTALQEQLENSLLNTPATHDGDKFNKKYAYFDAEIISYTTSLRNNTMIINKGKEQGVREGMAVLDKKGLVGITKRCTENFCKVLPLIHSHTNISAKVGGCDCYGTLSWTSTNPNFMQLNAIPKHVSITEGDSVLTSGFSMIFPPNILIGKVVSASIPQGSNFYDIEVKTVNDFYSLHYVYVVENLMKEEFDSLMNEGIDERE